MTEKEGFQLLERLLHEVSVLRRLNDAQVHLLRQLCIAPTYEFMFVYRDKKVVFWLPHCMSDLIQRRILEYSRFFESDVLSEIEALLPDEPHIVDAGANIGNHSVYFGLFCNAGKVLAFEPQKQVFPVLERNIELNGLASIVEPHSVALGAKRGFGRLSAHRMNNLGATVFQEGDEPSRNDSYTFARLDDFSLGKLDLLKIDVEGGQIPLLVGAEATIASHRPLILMEIRQQEKDEFGEINRFLQKFGYNWQQIKGDNILFDSRATTRIPLTAE